MVVQAADPWLHVLAPQREQVAAPALIELLPLLRCGLAAQVGLELGLGMSIAQ